MSAIENLEKPFRKMLDTRTHTNTLHKMHSQWSML